MSIRRAIEVVCDNCLTEQDQHFWTVSEARLAARADGWGRRGNRDLCPNCLDKPTR